MGGAQHHAVVADQPGMGLERPVGVLGDADPDVGAVAGEAEQDLAGEGLGQAGGVAHQPGGRLHAPGGAFQLAGRRAFERAPGRPVADAVVAEEAQAEPDGGDQHQAAQQEQRVADAQADQPMKRAHP